MALRQQNLSQWKQNCKTIEVCFYSTDITYSNCWVKKILVQYFLLKMTLKPEFKTGRQILTIFPRCSQVEIQFSYLTVVLLKWKDCVDRNFVLICKTPPRLCQSVTLDGGLDKRVGLCRVLIFCGFRRLWSLICLLKHTHYWTL